MSGAQGKCESRTNIDNLRDTVLRTVFADLAVAVANLQETCIASSWRLPWPARFRSRILRRRKARHLGVTLLIGRKAGGAFLRARKLGLADTLSGSCACGGLNAFHLAIILEVVHFRLVVMVVQVALALRHAHSRLLHARTRTHTHTHTDNATLCVIGKFGGGRMQTEAKIKAIQSTSRHIARPDQTQTSMQTC